MHNSVRSLQAPLHRFRSLAAFPLMGVLALGVCFSEASAVEIPPSAQPGRVEKRIAPPTAPTERLQLTVPPAVESQRLPEALRKKLEANKFALKTVTLEGATAYSAEDLAFAYNDMVGKTISLLDARTIATRITTFYRNKGYILSQAVVPTQDVTDGTLKLRVIEGYISNVSYEGDIHNDTERSRLDGFASNIKALRPAKMTELERYMLLMNDLPGQTITGLIRPSTTEFGAADLVLTVRRRTLEASYTFDNRGSKYLGPWQHTFMAGANSIFNAYDHTQVRFMTVNPWKELFLAEVQHDEILDSEGTKLTLTGAHTRTQPGDDLKIYKIVGESDLVSAKISHPFLRLRQQSLVARAQFDVRNTAIDMFSLPLTRDRLRVLRAGATYNFLDTLQGSDSIDVQISQGLNIFSATDKGDDRSNPYGDSQFTKVNFDVSRLQPLDDGFSILTSATGQYGFQALLSDEQFSFGGADYARAFDPAEALGDSGLGGKIEFRYDGIVEKPYFDSYQLYTSFDLQEAWKRGTPAGSDTASTSLASWSVGSRVKFTEFLFGSVELSVPLMAPDVDQTSYRDDPRIFFSITARY
jgi:hemolysin activation/secretion protein